MEKLVLVGFGDKNQRPPMSQWTSGTWNSYSSGPPGSINWPFARSESKDEKTPQGNEGWRRQADPSYYSSLPGAITGNVPVVYYESCDPNAYYQPAIVNYCTGPSPNRVHFKRSMQVA